MSCCIVQFRIGLLALILFFLSIFLSFTAKFVSQFSPELCKLELSNMVYIMKNEWVIISWDWDSGSWLLFFYFYPCFFLSLYHMLTLKICVGVFSGIFKARMLKLSIHMNNELLYYEMENWTPCSYSSLYLSIFYPVFFVFVFRLFFVFVFRLLRIRVTVFFATYLLLLIYSSALLKQCSGAIVRFSDSSSFCWKTLGAFAVQNFLGAKLLSFSGKKIGKK